MSKPQSAREPVAVFYANFPRRLKAILVDSLISVIFLGVMIGLITLAQNISALRIGLTLLLLPALIFYEPLSVWLFGGTVGHRAMNLRVVDNRTGQNVSFGKAILRFFMKTLLGILSFLTMSFTRRHQAVHDLLTRSTVQIRDLRLAEPYHYTRGR